MTGLGYMVMVSSLTAEDFADFFGLDGAKVKSWCDGKEDISENAEKLISEKGTYYRLYTGAFELE